MTVVAAIAAAAFAAEATATAITAETTAATAAEATATATTTPEAAATATAAEPTAGRALFARTGDVHGEGAIFKLVPVELLHGLLRLVGAAHRDEGKATRTTGELVEDDLNDADSADLTKQGLEILRGAGERKVPHVELGVV